MVTYDQGLQKQRILVTRASEQAGTFSEKIKEHNGIPVEVPLLSFEAPKEHELIKEVLLELHKYQWIVFTSVNGVQHFFKLLDKHHLSLNHSCRPRIAVVGKKTLEALEKYGYKADVLPDSFVAESLYEELSKQVVPGDRILLARGNLARSILPEQLRADGLSVTDLIVYETVVNHKSQTKLNDLIHNHLIDIVTFTSSSTVKHFFQLLEDTNWKSHMNHVTFACIGPIAARTAEEYGIKVTIIPAEYTIDGLIQEMISYISRKK